jgi:alanyl-tRNA synthetase
LTGTKDLQDKSLNVIADHIRACAFLIADGVVPARDGRGYVLRRIIRRAIRHGYKLGQHATFFSRMVQALVDLMGDAYPELRQRQVQIETTLLEEEVRFSRTLDAGMGLLQQVMARTEDEIDGATAFLLYDTYGFPLDLTQDIARENGLGVDQEGFNAAMARQQERGRSSSQFARQAQIPAEAMARLPQTEFLGYEQLATSGARIVAIVIDGELNDQLDAGQQATVFLDRTPFYAESGGQVGDTGSLKGPGFEFVVEDTIKVAGVFFGHLGVLKTGHMSGGDLVDAAVDAERRRAIVLHHSATHLMHAALKQILGKHVEQRGSLVAPDHLRFDFTHPRAVTAEEIRQIERLVNREIRRNPAAKIEVMNFDDALKTGAAALFGEKYGDRVRVLQLGDFSIELCGGTHVHRVGDIGQFKIIEESAIAAGIRRMVAAAGEAAVDWIQNMESRFRQVAGVLNVAPESVDERVQQLLERNRALEKDLDEIKARLANARGDELAGQAVDVGGVKVLTASINGIDAQALRSTVDRLKEQLGTSIVVIASSEIDKVRIAAGVSKDLIIRIQAGNLVNFVAQQVGGKGGGRADFAQAGGNQPENLEKALSSVAAWVSDNI